MSDERRIAWPRSAQAAQRAVRVEPDPLDWVMGYVADLHLVNHGPLADAGRRCEAYTLAGGDLVRAYGATPREAIRAFAAVVRQRVRP